MAPRILYSADAAALIDPAVFDAATLSPAFEISETSPAHADQQTARALVVVDESLDDVEALIGYLDFERSQGAAVDWLLLEADSDGVHQVSGALAQAANPYSSVHLISHGADGRFDLGSSQLTADDLSQYAESLSSWQANLTEQADILIYACDFSATEQGQILAENLAELTGADIATSNNLTGHFDLGGDWILENSTGPVEAGDWLDQNLSDQWLGTLALDPSGVDTDVPADPTDDHTLQDDTGGSQIATNGTSKIVVWETEDEIYFRRFSIDGTAIDLTDQLIQNDDDVKRKSPTVALAANGEFVIAWTSRNGQDGSGDGVFAQRFNSDGSVKARPADAYSADYSNTSEFRVASRTAGKQSDPAIAMRDDGVFVISWSSPYEILLVDSRAVMYSVFNADGTRMQAETPASRDAIANESHSAVAFSPVDGSISIAFEQNVTDDKVQIRRVSPTGQISGGLIDLQVIGRDLSNPSIGVTDSGTTFVVAQVKGGGEDIFMWLIDSDNNLINSVPIQVNEVAGGKLANAEVAIQGEAVVVVWDTNQGAHKTDIAARQFDGAGNFIGAEVAVNAHTDQDQEFPGVVVHGSTVTVVWSGEGVTDDKGVAMRLLDIRQPGVQVTPSGTVTTEAGGAVDVSIVLTSEPAGVVTVSLLSSDSTEGLPALASLAFDASNWDTPQTVSVQGQDDLLVDGDVDYKLLVSVSSVTDASYNALAGTTVALTNQDDDVPAVNDVGPLSDVDPVANQVSENATAGTAVGLTGFATDPDLPDTVSYSISGATSSLFQIDPLSGVVTTSADPTDYEAAASHSLTVHAHSSDGSVSERTFSIAVADQNDTAPIIDGGQSFQANENTSNGTAIGTVTATDPDTVGSLQAWTITGGTGQAYFGITPGAGQILVTDSAGLDFETNTSFTLLLTVSDGTNTAAPTSVTINLSDINEVPQGGDASSTAVEDTDYVFSVGDFVFTDADAGDSLSRVLIASLPGAGSLLLNGTALDGLTPLPVPVSAGELAGGALIYRPATNANGIGVASFSVQVVDGAEQASSVNTQSINISAVNDAPVINSYGGTVSTTISASENTTAAGTVAATDADGDSIQYFASGPDAAAFTVDLNSGVVSFSAAPDFESPADADTDNSYEVMIEARDGNGGSSFQALTVTVSDQNDVAPVVGAGQAFGIAENEANGSIVGMVGATDADSVGSLQSWSITGGSGQSLFTILPGTGQLIVADGSGLNFEGINNFTLNVSVSDGVNVSPAEVIFINVANVNEAPSGSNGSSLGLEDTDYVFATTDFGFTDPDTGDSLGGLRIESLPASGVLMLNGTSLAPGTGLPVTATAADLAAGQLVYRPAPDQFGLNLASFGFRVVDNAGLVSAIQTQSISASGVNDTPTVQGTRSVVVAVGGAANISNAALQAVDIDDVAAQLIFTLNATPTSGQLTLDGEPLNVGETFSQSNIDTGRLAYVSAASADMTDSLSLTVRDSAGASSAEIEMTLISIGNAAIAPPAADNAVPRSGERAQDSPTEADDSADAGDDDESKAGVLQTMTSSPQVSNSGKGSVNASIEAADADGGYSEDQSAQARNTGRERVASHQQASAGDSSQSDQGFSLSETLERRADRLLLEYRRGLNAFSPADFQQLSQHIDGERVGLLSLDQRVVASSVAVSSGLSISYVLWLLRSGALLSSVLASIPAWRSIDPLPVLASLPGKADANDDKSLQEMLEKERGRDDVQSSSKSPVPIDA